MSELLLLRTTGEGAPAVEQGGADPAKLVSGTYQTKTWNHFTGENGRLHCGIWESTPGKVTVDYSEWEFCHVISGRAVLTNEEGKSWTVAMGDALIILAGFKGTWETVETVRKHYVILLPA